MHLYYQEKIGTSTRQLTLQKIAGEKKALMPYSAKRGLKADRHLHAQQHLRAAANYLEYATESMQIDISQLVVPPWCDVSSMDLKMKGRILLTAQIEIRKLESRSPIQNRDPSNPNQNAQLESRFQ